jgi:hypothetical protein
MDFLETMFGIAPDGGSGSVEAACIAVALCILAAAFFAPRIRNYIRLSQSATHRSAH